MEAGGGFVEDVERAAGGALLQFRGQLDALCLAAGQRGGGLAEAHVPQPHLGERLEVAGDRVDGLEEFHGLADGHVEDLGDGLALVVHLQRLAVVSRAVAHLAGDVDVREEVHLDLDGAVAHAVLAAPALDVEREAARLVAAHLRLGRLGEQRADLVEHPGVGGGVRAWRAPDGRLVHLDHLVDVLEALEGLVPPGHRLRAVDGLGGRGVEDGVDQGGLPGAGHSGDGDELAQVEGRVDAAQVVLARAAHDDLLPVAGPTHRRDRDRQPP